jgi:CO dehydrogenase/acetyl-CoA synthase beta subunit
MPSKSKTQQRLFGMAAAYKSGDLETEDLPEDLIDKIKNIADNMSKEEIDKFAKTKHKNIPEKKFVPNFDEFINEKQQEVVNLNSLNKKEHEYVMGILKKSKKRGLYDIMDIIMNSDTPSGINKIELIAKMEKSPRSKPI